LLPAGNLLQLDFINQACTVFLLKQLDASNCLGIRAFADLHNCAELLLRSEAIIKKQFLYDNQINTLNFSVINYLNNDNYFQRSD